MLVLQPRGALGGSMLVSVSGTFLIGFSGSNLLLGVLMLSTVICLSQFSNQWPLQLSPSFLIKIADVFNMHMQCQNHEELYWLEH